MAITLTVGNNSYVDLADSDQYFEARLHSDAIPLVNVMNASADNVALVQSALILATKILDSLTFIGRKVDINQKLQWPRRKHYNEYYSYSSYYDDDYALYNRDDQYFTDDVPQIIKDGQFEIAYHIIVNSDAINNVTQVDSIKAGNINLAKIDYVGIIPDIAIQMLYPVLHSDRGQFRMGNQWF